METIARVIHVSEPMLGNGLLCVPGSAGSDYRGEPSGHTGSVQRCASALEI